MTVGSFGVYSTVVESLPPRSLGSSGYGWKSQALSPSRVSPGSCLSPRPRFGCARCDLVAEFLMTLSPKIEALKHVYWHAHDLATTIFAANASDVCS